MIAVVDYHKGNLKSVERGLIGVGLDARITDDLAEIAGARAIVLPGVGSFTDAALSMQELGQMELLRERILAGVPFLGICLGLHLLFEGGVEHAAGDEPTPGLGILPGIVGALPRCDAQGREYKIPHVGWNNAAPVREGIALFDGLYGNADANASGEGAAASRAPAEAGAESCAPGEAAAGCAPGSYFYFTHSYAVPDSSATIATTTHSITFPSAVQFGDVCFGVQFHPEKSSDEGARLLRNFAAICG